MTCSFDLAHYRELLGAARAGGYRFAGFDREPEAGDLLLRHDVDLSLPAAVELAELEAEEGAWATYFLMRESVFYNLDSEEGRWALERLRALGHRVGLHAVWPTPSSTSASTRSWRGTTRTRRTCREPVEGGVNVMQAPWFTQGHYRSDSNRHWRSGCPHEELARGEPAWLQLLTHPEIWVYPGDSMRETMLAMLDAERERRLEQLAATGSTCRERADHPRERVRRPGTAALLRGLRENGERSVRLVGTDMSERSVGRHLCDAFHVVPGGSDPAFPDAMLEVCRREGVQAVLPQSSFDLEGLAGARERFEGIAVLVASPEAIRRSNDKAETYALLDRIGVPGPTWRRVTGGAALAAAAYELGYPGEDVCMKPVFSSGSRGFRIISASADRREQLLTNRPGVAEAIRLEELVELLGDNRETELLVMELARAASGRSTASPAAAGSCWATRRRARRCAPGSRCSSRRSTIPG